MIPPTRRPVFADPKSLYAFLLIFGPETQKLLLIELLNALLGLEGPRRIADLRRIKPEQRTRVAMLRRAVLEIECLQTTASNRFRVKLQLLNVEDFEKRIVYGRPGAYVTQLRRGEARPKHDEMVGLTICDFELWPEPPQAGGPPVPMLSRWLVRDQQAGTSGPSDFQHVVLELPKYAACKEPATAVERWAYFFREAGKFETIPPALEARPYRDALEAARLATFSSDELDLYDQSMVARQDMRGVLSLARAEGRTEGRESGLQAIRSN